MPTKQNALERIRKRGTRLKAGLDPAELADYAIIGAAKIVKGTVKFTVWSKEMVDRYGSELKPHLTKLYAESKKLSKKPVSEWTSKTVHGITKPAALATPKPAAGVTPNKLSANTLAWVGHTGFLGFCCHAMIVLWAGGLAILGVLLVTDSSTANRHAFMVVAVVAAWTLYVVLADVQRVRGAVSRLYAAVRRSAQNRRCLFASGAVMTASGWAIIRYAEIGRGTNSVVFVFGAVCLAVGAGVASFAVFPSKGLQSRAGEVGEDDVNDID